MSMSRCRTSPSCYREVNLERLYNEIWMYRKAHFLKANPLILTELASKYLKAWEGNPNLGLHSWLDDEHVDKSCDIFEGCDRKFNKMVDEETLEIPK